MSQNWNPGGGQPPGGGPPPGGGYGGPPPPGGGGYGGPPPPGGGGYGGPPPGGYGGPPPGGYGGGMNNPYAAPQQQPFGLQPAYTAPIMGSLGLGFLAGFFGGCIGLILVYAIAKGPETKKGAGMGFAAQIVIGVVMRAMAH
jgi:hypothetical protein